jgi:hypothetical protein
MALTAQSVVQRVVGMLQDTTSIRWPVNELVRWLNDGQREVVAYRPDSMNTTATMTLSAGTRQSLSSATANAAGTDKLAVTPAKLLEISRNMAGTLSAVRLVAREILDAQTPGWHSLTGVATVLNYTFDSRDPKTFYVYPPATTAAKLEVMYAGYPTDVTEPADGALYSAVTGNISIPDIYANALLDYILYRAYSKDSEYAGNAARSQSHYGAFVNTMGVEVKATVAAAPQMKPGTGSGSA